MKHLQIKNMPGEMHEKLRQRAESEGVTMSQYVIELLRQDLAHPGQREWLRTVLGREPSHIDSRELVEAVRAGRDERDGELDTASRRD